MKKTFCTYHIIVDEINAKPIGATITRKELFAAVKKSTAKFKTQGAGGVDYYRRLLTALRYLYHKDAGVFKVIKHVDITSTHELRKRYDLLWKDQKARTSILGQWDDGNSLY